MSGGSNDSYNDSSRSQQGAARSPLSIRRCPYAVLNLHGRPACPGRQTYDVTESQFERSRRVTDDEIRDAYKRLSRFFHPDKRPPGCEREYAQAIFIELTNAYEILSDPVLRQAYDYFGHPIVATLRHNRYDSTSLYGNLSRLHQQGKPSEALEMLSRAVESLTREMRQKDWTFDGNINVGLHVNTTGDVDWIDISETSVDFSAAVPLPVRGGTNAPHCSDEHHWTTEKKQQKLLLAIGAQSYLDKGLGVSRGILTATYTPSPKTSVSSGLSLGRKHMETTLSSVHKMNSGTVFSAKMSYRQNFGTREHEKLSFGFTSSRSLFLVHKRPVQATFGFGFGLDPSANSIMQIQYGFLTLNAWGFNAGEDYSEDTKGDDREGDNGDDSDSRSDNDDFRYNETKKKQRSKQSTKTKSHSHHPPRISAKLSLGSQFPIELGIEQSHLFNCPLRSIESSISYNPFQQSFKWKSMLSRELSPNNSLSIGIQHIGLNGLTWLLRYQLEDLTISVPIFVASFLSPEYWNKFVRLSLLSFLIDETFNELSVKGEGVSDEKSNAPDVHDMIAAKAECNFRERQWMSSSAAKLSASQQLLLVEQIAKSKRVDEETKDGLVILVATYSKSLRLLSSRREISQFDVTQALQFWVHNSSLVLPATSKSVLLGFHELCQCGENNSCEGSGMISTFRGFVDALNSFLGNWGIGKKIDCDTGERGHYYKEDVVLSIRYRFRGTTYETEVKDDQAVSLPSENDFVMGKSDLIS